MPCHREPQQLPPAEAQHQKREQSLKGQGRNHKQINGRDRLRVVPEECLPALRRRPTLHHVFRHRRLGDLKAKHQQLAMDPRCSPLWVFLAHLSNEIAQLSIDLWPPCPLLRFPTPERRETRTMPAKDGLRLNDLRCTKQARPEPGHPDQQGPVTAAQSKTRRCTPQGDAKLMAKEQVLRFKSARRLEEVNDEHYERMQEREHRPRSCDDSTRRRDSQAGRNFRKGQPGAPGSFLSESAFQAVRVPRRSASQHTSLPKSPSQHRRLLSRQTACDETFQCPVPR